jgi:flavodoxin
MKIAVFYESKSGNGKAVVGRLSGTLSAKGMEVEVHHIDEVAPKEIGAVDFYLFSSPTRLGKPIGSMKRFLKKAKLPEGAKYALIATLLVPTPNKKTGIMPTQEELDKWQRTIPVMDEILTEKGATKVADLKVYVSLYNQLSLEDGWEKKVDAFADELVSKLGR